MEPTLTDLAYLGLREKLAKGELRAGQRIVNRTIAKELKVSQTPLREAVNRLASEGIIEYVPGAGAYVRQIDAQELIQLYDLREHIEPFAGALAAENASSTEIVEMRAICRDWKRLTRQIRDGGRGSATDDQMARWNDNEERFHTLLFRASRNRWLVRLAGNLRLLAVAFTAQRGKPDILDPLNAAVTWREHLNILRAIRSRDGEQARALLALHIRNGRRHVLKKLSAEGRGG